MFFLHINSKNFYENIKKLNNIIANKYNKIFILYYMEGCGPCNATRPEWSKIKNINMTNSNDIYIVDIDQILSSKINGLPEPNSFPTIQFVTNGGKIIENYEDSSIDVKDRTIDSFIKWIKYKSKKMTGGKYMTGGKKNTCKNRKKKTLKNRKKKTIKNKIK
jgi:hypothetical protein